MGCDPDAKLRVACARCEVPMICSTCGRDLRTHATACDPLDLNRIRQAQHRNQGRNALTGHAIWCQCTYCLGNFPLEKPVNLMMYPICPKCSSTMGPPQWDPMTNTLNYRCCCGYTKQEPAHDAKRSASVDDLMKQLPERPR